MRSNQKLLKYVSPIYFISMFTIYFGHVYLENYRFRVGKNIDLDKPINIDDLQIVKLLGITANYLELIFLVFFILVSVFCIVVSKKEKSILIKFFILNVILILTISLVSFVISIFSVVPITNLLFPLIMPVILMFVMAIYAVWLFSKKERK